MRNKTITDAILRINSEAQVSVSGGDLDSITWENGTTPISKADIEAEIAKHPTPTEEEEAAARETEKASGKQKLKDLGLSDAEIKALTGA